VWLASAYAVCRHLLFMHANTLTVTLFSVDIDGLVSQVTAGSFLHRNEKPMDPMQIPYPISL
jgi:hypothetical protein